MNNVLITPQAFTYLSFDTVKSLFGDNYTLHFTGGQVESSSNLINYLQDMDACLIGSETINESILQNTPKLKFLSRFGVGYDSLNIKDLNKFKVQASIVQNINNEAVARHCLSLLLGITNNIVTQNTTLSRSTWDKGLNIPPEHTTVGLIGMGPVAKEFAKMCEFLGFNVVYFSRTKKEVPYTYFNTIKSLIKNSNIISLHLKCTSETTNIIDAFHLDLMKGKYLINTARGKLVNETYLYKLLHEKIILGAGLDVFTYEPSTKISSQIRTLPNVVSTCHMAAYDSYSILQVATQAINNIKYFFDNKFDKINTLVTNV
jgi:phosphoglycerate dehydrogenase-like enzyme